MCSAVPTQELAAEEDASLLRYRREELVVSKKLIEASFYTMLLGDDAYKTLGAARRQGLTLPWGHGFGCLHVPFPYGSRLRIPCILGGFPTRRPRPSWRLVHASLAQPRHLAPGTARCATCPLAHTRNHPTCHVPPPPLSPRPQHGAFPDGDGGSGH